MVGGSSPLKRGWSHAREEVIRETSDASVQPDERERAVRPVRNLEDELGEKRGCAKRDADQLGFGFETVPAWARQADIDEGLTGGATTDEAERIKTLEQENLELRRANSILKSASAFFAAELDRPQR